jgi:hypothetical protein
VTGWMLWGRGGSDKVYGDSSRASAAAAATACSNGAAAADISWAPHHRSVTYPTPMLATAAVSVAPTPHSTCLAATHPPIRCCVVRWCCLRAPSLCTTLSHPLHTTAAFTAAPCDFFAATPPPTKCCVAHWCCLRAPSLCSSCVASCLSTTGWAWCSSLQGQHWWGRLLCSTRTPQAAAMVSEHGRPGRQVGVVGRSCVVQRRASIQESAGSGQWALRQHVMSDAAEGAGEVKKRGRSTGQGQHWWGRLLEDLCCTKTPQAVAMWANGRPGRQVGLGVEGSGWLGACCEACALTRKGPCVLAGQVLMLC